MTAIDFPDWNTSARSAGVNYQALNQGLALPASSAVSSNVFYTGNFDTIGVSIAAASALAFQWSLTWLYNPAAPVAIWAEPTFQVQSLQQHFVPFGVKGPFARITATNLQATPFNVTAIVNGLLSGDNPGDVYAPQVISDASAVTVGASSTVNEVPTFSIAGPANLWGVANQAYTLRLQRWNGSAWLFAGGASAAANVDVNLGLIIPGDDIRLQLGNGAASSASFFYSLVHGG